MMQYTPKKLTRAGFVFDPKRKQLNARKAKQQKEEAMKQHQDQMAQTIESLQKENQELGRTMHKLLEQTADNQTKLAERGADSDTLNQLMQQAMLNQEKRVAEITHKETALAYERDELNKKKAKLELKDE